MQLVAGRSSKNFLSWSLLSGIMLVLASFTIQHVSAQPSQETWQIFKDPENEFSIEYPLSWQLKPAENRFALADLNLVHSNGAMDGLVDIKYNIMPEQISQIFKEYNYDQKDVENNFDTVFPPLLTAITGGLDSFVQTDDTDYNKYKIDGHRTASIIFSFKVSELDLAGWTAATIIGNKIFTFNYAAGQNQFDTNFPVAERMLDTIKILDK